MSGTLYLVPTPIGNLGDISPRALETLETVDFIAAEDTRVTLKLLNHFQIKKSMLSYHRHSADSVAQTIVDRLLSGESCALVTDAGTPAVSDPGEDLVRLCVENAIPVCALPGPCALTTALSVSGLPTARFTFEGFLPTNKKNRQSLLESLIRETRTMIFYEAPHKLLDTLEDFVKTFGEARPIALCRELTKLHEEVRRCTLGEALSYYRATAPRGEFVLILAGAEPTEEPPLTAEAALPAVFALVDEGASLKDAVKQVAKELKLSKNQLYALAVAEKS